MVHEPKKIGLLVHTGNGNLGDDLTLTAVMSSIRSRWPAVIFYGFSMNPGDTPNHAMGFQRMHYGGSGSGSPPTRNGGSGLLARNGARKGSATLPSPGGGFRSAGSCGRRAMC